jgi:hypothetical protein
MLPVTSTYVQEASALAARAICTVANQASRNNATRVSAGISRGKCPAAGQQQAGKLMRRGAARRPDQ